MRIVHTADWHLGHALYDRDRETEHAFFLDWLLGLLEEREVDALSVRVVGLLPRNSEGLDLERLVVPLRKRTGKGEEGEVGAWVAAVPFLRLGDVPGGEIEPGSVVEGVRAVYAKAIGAAREKRKEGQALVATEHCKLPPALPLPPGAEDLRPYLEVRLRFEAAEHGYQAEIADARAVEVKTQAAEAMERLQADRAKAGLPAEVAVDAALAKAAGALAAAQEAANARQAAKLGDDAARVKLAGLEKEIDEHARTSRVWLKMDDLVGSQDGKKFRIFVQSLTLEALVQAANHHLRELARRYRLERVPGTDMDLQIVDSILGDERRSVQSLSGGETFLVSLGLALGLSSLATQQTRVETLFVDEGFGTLDADTLDKALSALEALQASGRRVGIISHVAALTDRIATRVVVTPKGVGRSTISVVGLS